MRFEHVVGIDAPVEDVWALVADPTAWPGFVASMTSVERIGEGVEPTAPPEVGANYAVVQPGQPPMIFVVTELQPPASFVWETRTTGLTMAARHLLTRHGTGCQQRLVVDMDGFAAPVFGRLFRRRLRRVLPLENAGFKRRAERGAP